MEQYAVIQESINTFDTWISPIRINKANAVYQDLAGTREGQLKILNDASSGNTTAADFLFYFLRKIIAKAFWKYYLGPNTAFHAARIRSGDDKDFASMAYTMLLGNTDETSPYATFKPSKFSSKANLLKQFGYYLYRYLQNEAVKMNRAEIMGGMVGNVKHVTGKRKEMPHVDMKRNLAAADKSDRHEDADEANSVTMASYDSSFDNDSRTASPDISSNVDFQVTWESFLKKLKKDNPKFYRIVQLRAGGFDIDQVAAKLGISGQSVRNYLKDIKKMYDKFTGV